jgi:hypothetical protein
VFESEQYITCNKCGEQLIPQKQIINGRLMPDLIESYVPSDFVNELKHFKNLIPSKFFESKFELKHICAKLYDGVIVISGYNGRKKIERKYVIFDLVIPSGDSFTYNEKIEFLYNRINLLKASYDKESIKNNLNLSSIAVSSDNSSDLMAIENACLRDFKNRNRYKNLTNVSINSSVSVKYNFLIPIFQSVTEYEGRHYINSVIGYKNKNRADNNFFIKLLFFWKKNKNDIDRNFCLNFPPIKKSKLDSIYFKYVFFYLLHLMCKFLPVILVSLIFVLEFSLGIYSYYVIDFIFILSLLSFVFLPDFFRSRSEFYKKVYYSYFSEKNMSEDAFFDELVKEKNKFIRHLEWK